MSKASGQQQPMLIGLLLQHCVRHCGKLCLAPGAALPLYLWVCLFFLFLFFRALLRELHGVGASYLFLLQRDGHGVSSPREGFFFLPFSLPFILLFLSHVLNLSFFPRWWCPVWPACARRTWVALNVSLRNSGPRSWRHGSTAQSREIPTFTSTSYTPQATSSACRDETSSWASSPHHPTGTEQFPALTRTNATIPSSTVFSLSLLAFLALPCVFSTCSSSLMSSRVDSKSRNPPSLFGLLYRTRQFLNQGIVTKWEQKFGRMLQCCCHEHVSHIQSTYPPPPPPFFKLQLSVTMQLPDYSAKFSNTASSSCKKKTPQAPLFLLPLDVCLSLPSIYSSALTPLCFCVVLQTGGMCSAGIQI